MADLVKMDTGCRDIANPSGLEYCSNLAYLDISNNQLSDRTLLVVGSNGLGEGDEVLLQRNNGDLS